MKNTVKTAESQLSAAVNAAIRKAIKKGTLPEAQPVPFNIEIPADRKNGDYSTNAAMAHARVFRMAPMKIAAALIDELELEGTYFSKCE